MKQTIGLLALLGAMGCGGASATQPAASGANAEPESGKDSPAATEPEKSASPETAPSSSDAAASPEQSPSSGAANEASPEPETAPAASAAEPASPEAPKEASEARITDKHIVISGKVQFQTGNATLKKASFPVLDEVVFALEKHPEIIKIQIVGHTDSDGDAKANTRLSKRRATSVMKYLIRNGIERDRLSAVGVGEDKPIASNDTEEGKEKNRRVEFVIVERAAVRAFTHTSGTAQEGAIRSREATADETEALIEKKGAKKTFE